MAPSGWGEVAPRAGLLASVKMTMTVRMRESSPSQRVAHRSWTVAEAKAKLSELIADADAQDPQVVTRQGRPVAPAIGSAGIRGSGRPGAAAAAP